MTPTTPPPPSDQAMMVQQLMGGQYSPQPLMGQNASTPYGAAFMTGNTQIPPSLNSSSGIMPLPAAPQTGGMPGAGLLGTSPNPQTSQTPQQPASAYSGAGY